MTLPFLARQRQATKPEETNAEPRPDRPLRIVDLLRPHKKALFIGLLAVIGESVASLAEPWPLKIVIDMIDRLVKGDQSGKHMSGIVNHIVNSLVASTFGADTMGTLKFAAVAVLAIAILGAVASYAEKYLTTSVGQWVTHDLRRILYSHVQFLSLSYHDRNQTGDLISRVTSDIDAIQSFITSGLLGLLVSSFTLVGMVVIMFIIDWQFALIALSVVPGLFVVVYIYTRRIRKASREVRKKEGEIVSTMQEIFSSIRVVKAFAREDYEQRRLEEESLESVETALRARNLKAKLLPIVEVIVGIGTCLVLWFGSRMVLAGPLTSGSLILFLAYISKMYKPMKDMSKMTDAFSKALVGYERIQEVLQTEYEVRDLPGAMVTPRFHGRVEFEHVSFSYTPGRPALRDINLRIRPGQVAALVGPTGAGKTTVISLIPRFFDPDSGRVRIDGWDVRRFTQKSLRQQISFVLQETVLFRAPVWQNIAYGKPEAGRDEILHAAELANAAEFIETLPDGYDTMVGERGVTLSGGQRQRIAIARAIIRNTPLLILDEPSSGLDASSEKLVFDALDRLMVGKTTIVIAHRLSTIRRADIIFVISDGTVLEHGNHRELLALGGLYSELYDLQYFAEDQEASSLLKC